MPVDPGIATLLDLIKSSGYPPMYDGTPELGRQALRAMTVDPVQPHDVIAVASVEDRVVAGRPARLYRPAGEGPLPTLLYFHGGGWVIGDLDTHDQLCRRICRDAEAVVLAIDYRLAPEAPYPAAVEDALAAVEWAADHLDELGGSEMLAVGGDSAGGNLSAVVAQALRDTVTAQVLLYPATHVLGDYASRADNAEGYYLEVASMEWFFGHYVTGVDGVDPDDVRISPLLGDVSGVAPALVVTAEFDPLRDEGEAYAAKLQAAGVPVDRIRYDAMVHSFHDMGMLSPAAGVATEDVVARIRKLLHG